MAGNSDINNPEALLKRAFLFLEDGEWELADDYCERVLDVDPENARAYLGKLMAEHHAHQPEEMADCGKPFDYSTNYQKAVRFGDEGLRSQLDRYINYINKRNEHERFTGLYQKASAIMSAATTDTSFRSAAEIFRSISGYRDAEILAKECSEKAEICRKDGIYRSAKTKMAQENLVGYTEALSLMQSIPGWKDADELASACQDRIIKISAERMANEQIERAKRENYQTAIKKKRAGILITAATILVCLALVIVYFTVFQPRIKRQKAMEMLENGDYDSAYALLEEINDQDTVNSSKFDRACAFLDAEDYESAYALLSEIGRYDIIAESQEERKEKERESAEQAVATAVPAPTEGPKPTDGPAPTQNPTPTQAPRDPVEPIGSVTVLVNALRVRSAPNTSGSELGKTTKGETFRVYAVSQAEGYTWYRIGKDAWIADKNGDYASFSKDTSPTSWDLDASIGMVEILTDSVQMSIAPSTRAEKTVWTAKGDQYWVYEISYAEYAEGYLWYRIGPDAWVADKDGKSVRYSDRIALLIAQAQGITPNKNDPMTFLGHTLGEVIKAFGDGYSTEDFGISGPYPGLFYPDNRTPYVFLYVDAYEKLGGRQIDENDLDENFVVSEVGLLSEVEEATIYGIAEYLDWINGSSGNNGGQNAATYCTDYYSVTIPAAIATNCVFRQHRDGFSLYEITSILDGYGGNVFSLVMYQADDFRFLDNPTIVSYQGLLTVPNGERFNLFFCQPTDVQWSSDGYDAYVACSECAEEILASLQPLSGVTLTKPKELNPRNKQVIFVSTYEYNGQYGARLSVAEWSGESWKTRMSDISAAIGSNGTTTDKHEGDHCTPSGTFNILFCFSDSTLDTGLRQKTLRDGDVWVTDQNSRYYNTIQSSSTRDKDWSKSENIYRQFSTGRSVAGIFFDYNGDGETAGSATPGAGAALFLDGVGNSGSLDTGYGDVKLRGEDMLRLLKVLNSSLNPVIIIVPE